MWLRTVRRCWSSSLIPARNRCGEWRVPNSRYRRCFNRTSRCTRRYVDLPAGSDLGAGQGNMPHRQVQSLVRSGMITSVSGPDTGGDLVLPHSCGLMKCNRVRSPTDCGRIRIVATIPCFVVCRTQNSDADYGAENRLMTVLRNLAPPAEFEMMRHFPALNSAELEE